MDVFPEPDGAVPEVPGYDVGRLLGRGATAAVWLATERSTGRAFALKCLDPGGHTGRDGETTGVREAEEAVRREVRILSALDHEHLLRAHEVLRLRLPRSGPDQPAGPESRETLALVLDYAPGGSAADLVAGRDRLSAGETVTILTPIAQALEYLHSQGFTHGDVSPGNVLFTAHGKPLLADVGVARMVADAGARHLAGTEGFCDPSPVDAVRSGLQPERDVYSLAALGWYCLTGQPPVPGALRPPLPLLVPDVPAALAAALEAGLAEDRRQRPTAAEFAALVYRSVRAEPVDLSVSVHPAVIPQLLTGRAVLPPPRGRGLGNPWHKVARAVAFRRQGRPTAPREARPSPRRPAGSGRTASPAGLRGRPGTVPAGGRHLRYRKSRTPQAIALAVAAMVVLAGSWLVADGGPTPDAVTGLISGIGRGPGAPVDAGTARGEESPAPPSRGLAGGSPPAPADAGAGAIRPDLEALLASADPAEAVRGLARLRSLAFSSGNFGLLDAVNAPGSAAAASDGRIRSQLSASGHVLAGFSTSLTRIQTAPDSRPGRAVLAITTESSAYREVDRSGTLVAEAPAASARPLHLVLVPVDGRWRIRDILSPGPGH